ncbi:MAG TPA: hypothetical protein DCX60_03865, partial [Phycisphaerales bacterium]|nr:hypothetical protein [Phycisphaerales bacterium]
MRFSPISRASRRRSPESVPFTSPPRTGARLQESRVIAFLEELSWRGLLHSTTSEDLAVHLATPGRVAYCGFDPTAEALTIGNYLPIKMLAHWQRAGHRPLALMGGATGLIGDPSGKSEERKLLGREQVEANIANYRSTFERLLDFDSATSNRA